MKQEQELRDGSASAHEPLHRPSSPLHTNRSTRSSDVALLLEREALHAEGSLAEGKAYDFSPQCDFSDAEYAAYYLGATTTLERFFDAICDEIDSASRRRLGDLLTELRQKVIARRPRATLAEKGEDEASDLFLNI